MAACSEGRESGPAYFIESKKTPMEQLLDQDLIQQDERIVKYAAFWPRVGAVLMDGLILAPVTFGITYLNITSWKSPIVLILITLLSVAYKPFMEFRYGATLGKMALKFQVVNLKFGRADLSEILIRNVFHIVPSLITLFFTVNIYQSEAFRTISSYSGYSSLISTYGLLQAVNLISGLIILVDVIVLLADKYNRSLHDKLAGTLVVEKVSLKTSSLPEPGANG